MKLQRILPPNIVKIDVEGAELDVLKGMVNVLQEWRPKVIIEVDDADKARCEEKLIACKEFLHDLHYRSDVLPASYGDGNWFVRHIVAQPESHPKSDRNYYSEQ